MNIIPLKNYENYCLCLDKMEVLSSDKNGVTPIKSHLISKKKYFFLFRNGSRKKVLFFEIISENWEAIQLKISKI